jgi:hypothetical protein
VPGDIWLADLAKALDAIKPRTEAEVTAIARLLGLAAPSRQPGQAAASSRTPAQDGAADGPDTGPGAGGGTAPDAGGGGAPAQAPGDVPLLQPVARRAVRPTGWGVRSLPRVDTSRLGQVPEREPLLGPRGAATILQTLIARHTPEGPLDVPALVDTLARREVPDRLPRQSWPTLRFGVQLLMDIALPMRPFQGDQRQLAARLKTSAGSERTSVRYFADVPVRGAGPGPRPTWRGYEPPDRGTCVLVVSDFGLGAPPWYAYRCDPAEWRSFVAGLRQAGCGAVALLPVAPDRWPAWLAALMPLVCWDRTATAGKVTAALRARVRSDD